jgi:hypothetical protein
MEHVFLVMRTFDETNDEVSKVCHSKDVAESWKIWFLIDEHGEEKYREHINDFWIWEWDVSQYNKQLIRSQKMESIEERRLKFNDYAIVQRKYNYPNFKNAIVKELTDTYDLKHITAVQLVFSSEWNKHIIDDIAWSQHMGVDYWAEVIYERYIQN